MTIPYLLRIDRKPKPQKMLKEIPKPKAKPLQVVDKISDAKVTFKGCKGECFTCRYVDCLHPNPLKLNYRKKKS